MDEIRIAAVSPELRVGDCAFNAGRMIQAVERLEGEKVDAVVFPELSLSSLSCGDLFCYTALLDAAESALHRLAASTKGKNIIAVAGLPLRFEGRIYDCAAVVGNGTVKAVVPKRKGGRRGGVAYDFADGDDVLGYLKLFFDRAEILPQYFFEIKGQTVTVAVGDDVERVREKNCIILNLGCDAEIAGSRGGRSELLRRLSSECRAVVSAYPSMTESTTDRVFSSHCIAAQNGEILSESEPFGTGMLISAIAADYKEKRYQAPASIDRDNARFPFLAMGESGYYDEILDIQAYGLKKRLEHIGAKKVLLGISGGLDSALAILVACRTMDRMRRPRADVIAVSMPAFGTTERSKNNAGRIAALLGADCRTIDIRKAVEQHFRDIGHKGCTADTAFENAQARERTQILMDLANMTDGISIGTGDLSELALGFATFGGDQISMYGVNGGVPKTLVRALVSHCGDALGGELQEVCRDICDAPISPELQPAENGEQRQKTEEIVGPYELHDFFIWHTFLRRESPRRIFEIAERVFAGVYDGAVIKKWMGEFFRRFFLGQFKRSSMPDGPMVTGISFSPRDGLSMPSDMTAAAWLDEVGRIRI